MTLKSPLDEMLRRAHIYLAQGNRPAIVSPVHYNAAGIYYEQNDPVVLPEWRGSGLAVALYSSLGRFSMRDQNLREYKKTDWPSYLVSHCRSVREFESAYLCIDVKAANEAELFFDASIQPRGEPDISLHTTINAHAPDEQTERQLVRLFDVASKWDVNLR